MDEFLDDFRRDSGQEIVDYNREWDKESRKAEKVAGELAKTWKAHLYVKKMRLTPELVSRLLSAAHGVWEVEPLKKAALITFPTVKGMFDKGSKKFGDGKDKKDKFGKQRVKKHFRKNGYRKGGRRTYEVDQQSEDDESMDESSDEDNEVNELVSY